MLPMTSVRPQVQVEGGARVSAGARTAQAAESGDTVAQGTPSSARGTIEAMKREIQEGRMRDLEQMQATMAQIREMSNSNQLGASAHFSGTSLERLRQASQKNIESTIRGML